jgi:hypothetical protein
MVGAAPGGTGGWSAESRWVLKSAGDLWIIEVRCCQPEIVTDHWSQLGRTMNTNIFHALLTYRPREGRSSKENFLTEAFAHTLRTNPETCRAWLPNITGKPLSELRGDVEVETQVCLNAPAGNKWSIVDMVVRCGLADGGELTILFEHKWDSPARRDQIDDYVAIAQAMPNALVVFIAPTVMQIADIREHTSEVKTVQWQEVHEFLHRSGADGVREFVEFLALQGLGPREPLSWPKLAAYVTSRAVEGDCLRIAAALRERDWTFLPKRFQTSTAFDKPRWGRVGIELNKDWNPALFLGFLMNGDDHQLPLLAPQTSIDLMLALDHSDTKLVIDPKIVAPRAEALRAPGVDVLYGTQLKSKWRKIVIRESLVDTIRGKSTEAEQVEAIYLRLRSWCAGLFGDGKLDKVL